MRAAFCTLAALSLSLGLVACGKPASKADAGEKKTLTIQNSEAPPAPPPKAVGGKLAVMDNPPPPAAAPAPPAPEPVADDRAESNRRVDPRPDPGPDPGYDHAGYGVDMEDYDNATLTRRDCRRAERFGDPVAASRACRGLLGPPPVERVDPQLVADCREARDIDDPFAASRACRAILGR